MKRSPQRESRQAAPRVIVAERVLRKMAAGAARYLDEETAESLVGLVIDAPERGEPDIYVLDTIPPDPAHIERHVYAVAQGDDWQDEVLYWLAINWRRFRERRRASYGNALAAKWDAPLRYLGDWHKHPGDMFWPSQGDLDTALGILHDADSDMPHLLVPIVTLHPPDEPEANTGYALYTNGEDGTRIRVDFWYLRRGMRAFIEAKTEGQSDQVLPAVPPLGWHLRDRERFQREHDLLIGDGLAVSVTEHDADELPPMEVCFLVGRMGGTHVLILVTYKDYPARRPDMRVAPMLRLEPDEDMFDRLWAESRPLDKAELPDWAWSPDRTLLELVRAVEEKWRQGREA